MQPSNPGLESKCVIQESLWSLQLVRGGKLWLFHPQPCYASLRPHRRFPSPTPERGTLSREGRGEPCRGPLLWVGLAVWPVTWLWCPGCWRSPAQVAWVNSHQLGASAPSDPHGSAIAHPQEGSPPPQVRLRGWSRSACRWGPGWLCIRNGFPGPHAPDQPWLGCWR